MLVGLPELVRHWTGWLEGKRCKEEACAREAGQQHKGAHKRDGPRQQRTHEAQRVPVQQTDGQHTSNASVLVTSTLEKTHKWRERINVPARKRQLPSGSTSRTDRLDMRSCSRRRSSSPAILRLPSLPTAAPSSLLSLLVTGFFFRRAAAFFLPPPPPVRDFLPPPPPRAIQPSGRRKGDRNRWSVADGDRAAGSAVAGGVGGTEGRRARSGAATSTLITGVEREGARRRGGRARPGRQGAQRAAAGRPGARRHVRVPSRENGWPPVSWRHWLGAEDSSWGRPCAQDTRAGGFLH